MNEWHEVPIPGTLASMALVALHDGAAIEILSREECRDINTFLKSKDDIYIELM